MELTQLRYFKALAECGNLTQTAKALYVSPPAVSVAIAKLEEELGVQLFTRMGGRMYLNEQGEIFLRSVNESLNTLSAGCVKARESALIADDHFSLATTNHLLWGELVVEFMKVNPKVRITQQELRIAEMQQAASNMQFDLFLTDSNKLKNPDMDSVPVFTTNEVLICLPKDHPLSSRSMIRMEELKDEQFLLTPGAQGLSAFYENLCREAGFEPKVTARCRFVLRIQLFRAGFGVMFITRRAYNRNLLPDSVAVPVEGGRFTENAAQSLYWHRLRPLTPAALAFRDFAASYYKD